MFSFLGHIFQKRLPCHFLGIKDIDATSLCNKRKEFNLVTQRELNNFEENGISDAPLECNCTNQEIWRSTDYGILE